MFRDRSRISKVARVKDGAAMFPKSQSWSLLALGLCDVLFAASLIGPSHKLKMPGKVDQMYFLLTNLDKFFQIKITQLHF